MKKLCISSFLFLLCVSCAFAQQQAQLITANFSNAKAEEFVSKLESETGLQFYYDPVVFDSLRVNLNISNQRLDTVLYKAFIGTPFAYTILADRQIVFLTRGHVLQTTIDMGLPAAAGNAPVVALAGIDDGKKEVIEATTENKLYSIGTPTTGPLTGTATLAGYVKEIKSGEFVVGASIYVPETKTGIATDAFGYYSLTLPKGKYTLQVRGLGMRDTRRQIMLYANGKLNIEMQEQVTTLREAKISAEKVANVRSTELGVNRLDIKTIKQVPSVFGEADILRVVLTLPGVQSVGEATTGFNVRGGSADQNLILLNDATIYNPAHFFGFFSSFNPDIVKDIQLYKSSIPASYGGRLSSILEVNNREGSKKIYTGSAGLGIITSRLNVEGPIIKDRTSFIMGGRITYSDWLLKSLPGSYRNSKASFYDFNLDISHQIDEKNDLYVSSYISNDSFRLNSDTTYGYSNQNIHLKWRRNYNNKLYSVASAGYDRYKYNVYSTSNPVNAYRLAFDINQANFKLNFVYYKDPKNTINFGVSSIYYQLHPGSFTPYTAKSLVKEDIMAPEQALESAVYLSDKYDISSRLMLDLGLRYSYYNYLGPAVVNNYAPGVPRTEVNQLGSTSYASGKFIKNYGGPEIRASMRYTLGDDMSIKAGYNTLRQYIHLLSNTTAIAPTDVWKLSDPNVRPQVGEQLSVGLYKNLQNNTIETSVEVYYKRMKDFLDYRSGATLVLNHNIERDVISTKGKAYGIEFMVRKTAGKLNGWASYTYSRTFLRQNDVTQGELVNGGQYYPANYDKPHSFNFTGNYRFKHRYSMSLNLVYSTGRPITFPIARYYFGGSERVLYSERNANRIPDYIRADISVNIEGNHKIKQLTHNSWTIGIYNITGRQNPYSTYFINEGGKINGYKLSIFASPIPFINYNIRF